MKTSLRTLTCALAAASVAAAAPAGANPGPQRVTGGPGASAACRTACSRCTGRAAARALRVPADYLLPAVTTRGELGGVSFDGRTVVLAYGRAGRGRALALPRGRAGHAHAAGLQAARSRSTRSRRAGSAIYLTRRASATRCRRATPCSQYNRGAADAEPGRHEGRVLGRGRRGAERLDDAGPAARRARRPPTAAGRTRSTPRASTRSSTRCRSGRAPGRPASSCPRRGARAPPRCACARPAATRSRCWTPTARVVATGRPHATEARARPARARPSVPRARRQGPPQTSRRGAQIPVTSLR